ncbi:MAG: iron ABC transporter permease [Phascolarctobacterium sp.]|uniref:FecCD family ABC transporter permease n=1 Tax=Phascolarctobacterium sp. TaxID=2049039 RepID=UPI0026DD1658|nr:iron ABC transporter permease [Phascolarctobacterium sp.]MDO4921655.1 iron ABC transporter permease [Phascolarctobacterium sp.]
MQEKIKKYKIKYIIVFLAAFLLIAMFCGLKLGFIKVDWLMMASALLVKLGLLPVETVNADIIDVILQLRLPRILLAACVGMGLTMSGIIMQAVVKNPLADPYILGVSSGASLGATSAIFLGLGYFFGAQAIGVCAFVGAFAVSLLVTFIADFSSSKAANNNLLLSGMAVSAVCSSISSLIAYFGSSKEGMEAITYWLMGNVANARIENVIILFGIIIFLFWYFLTQTRILNLMLVGRDAAMTLGVDLRHYIKRYLLLNGLLVGFIVFNAGAIGFIGLIIPHVVRLLFGANHKKLFPVAVLFGGCIAVVMDILSRTIIFGIDIPLGVIFALLGAPCFIYLLLKQNYRPGVN